MRKETTVSGEGTKQTALLICRNLAVGYDGIRQCENISFTLHEGEHLSVIGRDGSGKTALVSAILGLDSPMEGEVTYCGGLKRSEIGCMPQNDMLMGNARVLDTVLAGCLGGMNKWFVGRGEKQRAMDCLTELGAADLAARRMGELSGGQRQRVLLARALCSAERLLILDEPLRGLDAVAAEELLCLIHRIGEERNVSVIFINPPTPRGTVLHLAGKPVFYGTAEAYASSLPGQYFAAGRII